MSDNNEQTFWMGAPSTFVEVVTRRHPLYGPRLDETNIALVIEHHGTDTLMIEGTPGQLAVLVEQMREALPNDIGTDECKHCNEHITNVGLGWYHDVGDDCDYCDKSIDLNVKGEWMHIADDSTTCEVDDGGRYLSIEMVRPTCPAEPKPVNARLKP
jgi:hypothetical protein